MQNSNFNLGSMIDPSITTDQLTLARQQAMAAMLQQQGATPIDANRPYHISPLEGVAKLAQVLAAGRMNQSNDKSQAALSQKSMNAMAQMLGGGGNNLFGTAQPSQPQAPQMVPDAQTESQGGNAYAPPTQQSAPQQGQQPNNRFGLANLLRGSAIGQFGGSEAEKAFYADQARTEAAKRGAELGLTNQEQADAVRAENSVKGTLVTRKGSLPLQADPNNPGAMRAVPGSLDALISAARQEAQVHNENTLAPMQYSANGNPAPTQTIAQTLSANSPAMQPPMRQLSMQPPPQQPGMMNTADVPPEVLNAAYSKRDYHIAQNPDGSMQNIPIPKSGGGGGVYGAPPLGAVTAADAQQTEMAKKWEKLNSQNESANSVISYLDSIQKNAREGVVGPFSSELNKVNGLLSLVGDKRATDAVSANALLEKNHSQIVMMLGNSGLSTDASRAIISGAYPGKLMPIGAIDDASATVKGLQGMIQAKTALLAPHRYANNPPEYAKNEIPFDQNADPNVYRVNNMSPADQIKFVQTLSPQAAARFMEQRKQLKSLGALR